VGLQVEGTVAAIESAFNVNLLTYRHPTDDRTFFAPDREPTTVLPISLWHIEGLDNYSTPHSAVSRKGSVGDESPGATHGSGPGAAFLGSDMRAAYYGGSTLTGSGQNLGIYSPQGTDLADLDTYYANVSQSNSVPITLLSTDGTSTSCLYSAGCDDLEPTIDMTQALGMAPGLASLVMYIGSSHTSIISAMTTHSPLPTTISCSWYWTPADASALDPYFKEMIVQGQSFFAISGDYSTWASAPYVYPGDDAYVTSVGGTDLTTTEAGGPWASETAWSDSGGGVSPDGIAIPSWQKLTGVINSSNEGSTVYRNGPDVSANANFTFYVCADQETCTSNEWGGTSFAAPMWAAFAALANQQAATSGDSNVGFINPTLYYQNVTTNYSTDFHDITTGTSGSYSAVVGYDLVTGWGSPKAALIAALVNAQLTEPSNLIGTAVAPSVIALTWNAVTGGSGSISYNVQRCTAATSNGCTNFAQIAEDITYNHFSNTGLAYNTYYSYRIQATDANNENYSAYSNVVTVLSENE
jgi:hypothetical protein